MPGWIRWTLGLGMVLMLAGASIAAPEAAGPQETAGVSDAAGDSWSGETTLVIAYAALWVILMAYVVRLGLAQARLRREIASLQMRVDEGSRDPP